MEYILIIILQLLGIGFHVMQKIVTIGDSHKEKNWKEIFAAFLLEDWDTLVVSALILLLDLVVHFIVSYYQVPISKHEYYLVGSFGLALVLGYAGQRIVYKYLGSAEKFLDKKADDINLPK